MKFHIRLLVLVLFVGIAGLYLVAGQLTDFRAFGKDFFMSLVPPDQTEDGRNTRNAEITLKVLTVNCGQCHRSTLPTAKPKALAIFDLDKKPWYASVSDKNLEGISRRISKKSGVSETDRKAILEFIACLRKGECREKR